MIEEIWGNREDVYKKEVLLSAQKELTQMLKVIHDICEKNHISYWISDGTLLGAIRHKGFIPWDDDVDIGMLRDDYEKFLNIIEDNLPDKYKVESIENHIDGLYNFCKILYLDDYEWEDEEGAKRGLFLDIFSFDYVDNKKITFMQVLTHKIEKIPYPLKNTGIKNKLRRLLHKWNKILKIGEFLKKINKPRQKKFITYGIETPCFGYAYFNIEDIFPLNKIQFEEFQFYCPNNSHNYLAAIYGDYMKIPTKENQQTHMKNLRFKDNEKSSD